MSLLIVVVGDVWRINDEGILKINTKIYVFSSNLDISRSTKRWEGTMHSCPEVSKLG